MKAKRVRQGLLGLLVLIILVLSLTAYFPQGALSHLRALPL